MKLKSPVMLLSGIAGSSHPNDAIRGLDLLILLPFSPPHPMLASLTFPSWEQSWPPAPSSFYLIGLASPMEIFLIVRAKILRKAITGPS